LPFKAGENPLAAVIPALRVSHVADKHTTETTEEGTA